MASEVDKVLLKYGKLIVDGLKKSITEDDSIASRDLLQSVRPDIKRFGKKVELQIWMADHWKFVDRGRKPGKRPPMQPIQEWIARKGIPLKGKGAKKNQARTLAFLIARKIGLRGTKGTNFVRETINSSFKSRMKKEVSTALGKEIKLEITLK